ncbi:TPA: glycosyltransferase family 4 protein [Vibrio cholerae]|uniref:glycosyltransferase family 4 protein n=1 Tax=Vibrio cholerae TaxID=666 RepID=UPI0002C16066|nr:glycosyltransferase family 4 protein [Vibrio cholerae]EMQ71471.1 glycosyltransferase [Vibrio cholerae O1 str. NHCC-008D]QKU56862.1 glycosyltransferase family 4 protein [Vibrio cholerae]
MNKIIVLSSNTSWYIYNFRSSTIRALISNGYDVHCISPYDRYTHLLINELGAKWHEVKIDNKGSNPFNDLKFFYNLCILFFKLRPKFVLNFTVKNNIYGTFSAKFFGARVINNVSGLGTAFIRKNITTLVVKLLYKLSQPLADVVFCQNEDDFDFLIQQNLVSYRKLRLLPGSGVCINKFSPHLKTKREDKKIRFLFVGRMLKDKGIIELVMANNVLISEGYDFSLTLCGGIDTKNSSSLSEDELKNFCLNSNIRWIGNCDNMPSVYAESDCIVLPSYREGLPRTLLEAGAMGLPSVTTNVPGCKHVIENDFNGFICNVKDHLSLAKAMKRVLELSDDEYARLSINSRERVVERFDENIVVKKTLEVIL